MPYRAKQFETGFSGFRFTVEYRISSLIDRSEVPLENGLSCNKESHALCDIKKITHRDSGFFLFFILTNYTLTYF